MHFEPFNLLEVPVFCLDVVRRGTFRYTFANSAFAHLVGIGSERLMGREIFAQGEGTGDARLAHLAHQALGQSTPFRAEAKLAFGAEAATYDISIRRLSVEEGAPPRLLGTASPMGAIPQAREHSATLDVERFFALVAHDLRTPMRNVQSIAEVLLEDMADASEDKRELLEMLSRVGYKAGLMIEDVIAYVNAHSLESRDQDINLDDFCRDLLFTKDVEGRHTVSAEPVWVRVNTTALRIIVNNLMENAMRNGERDRLAFALRADPAEDGMLSFQYSDNGLGFSGLDNIVSDDRAARWNAGFGLASVRRIVLAEGGTLALARSELGDGGGLAFTLPAALLKAPG
ncbi:MAG: HAMP domain-containing sensor histidine kinase [Pseudomonadota bacterium]